MPAEPTSEVSGSAALGHFMLEQRERILSEWEVSVRELPSAKESPNCSVPPFNVTPP